MKLIGYLSNGYPTLEKSKELAKHYLDSGCDIIEVDFPDHNPYLENQLIQDRMKKALENCDDYEEYMESIGEIKAKNPNAQFILLAYETTVLSIGKEKFVEFAKKNDLLDLIFVGLKTEEIKDYLIEQGMRVSCYVQYHLPEEEVDYALKSNGFVYLQAKPVSDEGKNRSLKECIEFLKQKGIGRPIYCGVGIHAPEDASMAKEAGANGVFVGSAFLKLHDNIPELADSISAFKKQC